MCLYLYEDPPNRSKSVTNNKRNHPESPDPKAHISSSVPKLAISADLHFTYIKKKPLFLHNACGGSGDFHTANHSHLYVYLTHGIQCIAERRERSKPRFSGPQKGKRNSNVSASANSGR
ncbi:hypothetical protein D8674_038127 [Pyrus ussuriensis x Pyrus communis]|uniref:Uncharacterized protein n=1 Tax=Pyrus ussuriensis x Pyrus communis TaxID=2448454 RepID=A0A5N5I898_9ROSA|nr:hypothetical protein D8674_038127 [Pyrus ussuriensis x Pyrus communis]